MASPPCLARRRHRGPSAPPAPDQCRRRVGELWSRTRRALSRRPARCCARLGGEPRSGTERARARLPRREPGGERARGGAPAASQSPAPVAAGRCRRPARRCGHRRSDCDFATPGGTQCGHGRRRPAARGRGAQRGSPRPGASARQRRRRARRLARHPVQPALDAPAQPRDDRGPERRRRSVHVEGAQPRWSHARGR